MTGLGNYSRFVIESLADTFPENQYVLMAPKVCDNPRIRPVLDRPNISTVAPEGFFARHFRSHWRTYSISRLCDSLDVNLYHGLSNEIPVAGPNRKYASVVTVHDLIWRRFPSDYTAIDRKIYDRKYRRSAETADRIIAISERTRDDLVADWNIDPTKIDVIYQGCHESFRQPVSPDLIKEVIHKYGLPEKFIISVGTVQGRKNQLLAIKSLRHIGNDVKLVIVGNDKSDYANGLKKFIKDNGLENRVVWMSFVPFSELPALYAAATISSYTSFYEGFGIPLVESLGCGTPVIACTGSCLEEAGGPGAFYVAPDDVEGYVRSANAILNDSDLRRRLVAEGRQYIRRFDPSGFADKIMDTYLKAINRRRERAGKA